MRRTERHGHDRRCVHERGDLRVFVVERCLFGTQEVSQLPQIALKRRRRGVQAARAILCGNQRIPCLLQLALRALRLSRGGHVVSVAARISQREKTRTRMIGQRRRQFQATSVASPE
jgi:hypothetical protein